MISVSQKPDAHLFYEVDWTDWLAARTFQASDIVNVVWDVSNPSITVTFTRLEGAKASIWIKDVPAGELSIIVCTIHMPEPVPGSGYVTDSYGFKVFGG